MSDFLSFAEILEHKIRKEILAEFQSEKQASKPNFPSEKPVYPHNFTSVMIDLDPIFLPKDSRAQEYHKHKRTPPPPKPHVFSATQQKAFDLFQQLGAGLNPGYRLSELKKAFRQLCLKHHPDRGGSSDKFGLIKPAYSELMSVIQ